MLTPHAVTSDNKLYIGKTIIGENAMIGAKSTIMPGVKIGNSAMINAMSLVTMNTVIPANEIWGGIPARKLKLIEK